jgi:DNA-binding MarR family transcriptional regulator
MNTSKINVTDLEAKVLNWIAYADHAPSNGAKPTDISQTGTYLWVDEIGSDIGVPTATAKGAVGSLTAKDLISVVDTISDGEKENLVDFTDAGFAAWQAVDEKA